MFTMEEERRHHFRLADVPILIIGSSSLPTNRLVAIRNIVVINGLGEHVRFGDSEGFFSL